MSNFEGYDPHDGMPDMRTLGRRTLTRRKGPIECDMCRTPINIGTRYTCYTGLEDGKFFMVRSHLACPPDADEIRHQQDEAQARADAEAWDRIAREEIERAWERAT